jgi:hypothetical protein
VSLAGLLELDFIDGYAPKAGVIYDLIQITPGHSLMTDLSSLTIAIDGLYPGWQYSIDYDSTANAVLLTSLSDAQAVPEPTSVLLLAVAGAIMFLRRRAGAHSIFKTR